MSSYHSYFTYRDCPSTALGLVVCAFEPDTGSSSTFLGMDSIYVENPHTGVRYDYGAKYNEVATIKISLVTFDGSDFSVERFRDVTRWLSGATKSSWLDLYEGNALAYSFLCKCIDIQHYKMDGRIVGVTAIFESVSPWAYSPVQTFSAQVVNMTCVEHGYPIAINNLGDDKYSYIYPNVEFTNVLKYELIADGKRDKFALRHRLPFVTSITVDGKEAQNCRYQEGVIFFNEPPEKDAHICVTGNFGNTTFALMNKTTKEITEVANVAPGETITINSNQIISSSKTSRIFGKDFNFVWPKLVCGRNLLGALGQGNLKITYRYPIKIGDCAIDVNADLHKPMCDIKAQGTATNEELEQLFAGIYTTTFGGIE